MTDRRRSVCFVLPSLNGGGAERSAVHVLNALDGRRWDRSMYLFRREGPYLGEVDSSIELASGTRHSRAGRWLELRRFIRERRPDIVMSFLSYFSVLTASRAAATGARVIFNQQTPMSAFLTDADYHWRNPLDRRTFALVTRVGYRLADAVVTTSQGVADDLAMTFSVPRSRICVVHNPVNLDAIAASASEPLDHAHQRLWTQPAIVAAGRLADAKNYPLLLEAFAILRKGRAARLFILGEGERDAELRARIERLGLTEDVVLCGFQRNPWKYIARAAVFALTSRYEGFGNVLIEAMACGVPVVATSSPGTREIVSVESDGLLVDAHQPGPVAAALERVLADDALRARMAANARSTARRFSLPSIAMQYERVLAACAPAGAPA